MAVKVLAEGPLAGVEWGTAPGTDPRYVLGYTPLCDRLFVHETQRPASLIGVKYYHHAAGDPRGSDQPADALYSLTMLVSAGCWPQRIWDEGSGRSVEAWLEAPGDFIAWRPGLKHSWHPEQDSSMLTIRWKVGAERPAAKPTGGE